MRKHLLICAAALAAAPAFAADPVKDGELDRVKLVQKVRPAVVCVFMKHFAPGDPRGVIAGGGSGVIIDPEGYCLTNYHVVAAEGMTGVTPTFVCGLPNGELYDAVTVGCDRTGDVGLIKLFPRKPGEKFVFAELGDSGALKAGDWTLIMGNAQLLSTDFTPSVTFGLVSGVGRYSDFGFAEHTDAIQYDTTANQGNSGGPIFNMKGQVVGLVYGGAPGKRGAFNTGIGYGLPINTAKNFLTHMRAGIFCDHATLGATVNTQISEEGDIARLVVNQVLEESDAFRRGLAEGDELLNFAGREVRGVNQFKSALGIYPKEWRLPVTYKRGNEKKETLVRLMSYTPPVKKAPTQPGTPPPPKPKAFGEGAKYFEERKGFANYYFNRLERDRVLATHKKLADYAPLTGEWVWIGTRDRENRGEEFIAKITDAADAADAKQSHPVVTIQFGLVDSKLEPLKEGLTTADLTDPPYTGGLMMAIYQYKRFLTLGPKGSEGDKCNHAGAEPVYMMPADGSKPKRLDDVRVWAEVIRTEHADVVSKWYFYRSDLNPQLKGDMKALPEGALIAAEVYVDRAADPCELYFSEFRDEGGKILPHRIEVRNGDKRYANLNIKAHQMKPAAGGTN